VFSNRKWQQFALLLNLIGSLLLFYSFQATSSDFRLITATTTSAIGGEIKEYALCVDNYTLLQSNAQNEMVLGHRGCTEWANSKPAAVVSIEHRSFIGIGFVFTLAGFLLQLLSIPEPRTIASLRRELKELKLQERTSDVRKE